MKVYVLFGRPGKLSVKTGDYHGWSAYVLADSVRQAYQFVGRKRWIDPDRLRDGGVLMTTDKHQDGPWQLLWCGCREGLKVDHGSGIRRVEAAVSEHRQTCPEKTLRVRLLERLRNE